MKTRTMTMNLMAMALCLLGGLSATGMAHGESPFKKWSDRREARAGAAAANKDIGQGKVRYDIGGIPSETDTELRSLAAKRYNITVAFSGCIIGPNVAYDRAYRQTVIQHLKAKYGFDPVMKIEAELRAKSK
ncbi:hypothetical protein EI77_00582 [Prosthecobacter fusiformis]|uniref:Uncharacterized protein n=1 Tax=Prosthecobacter fusiformis TaxID=48464 RepID=A0A4R7SRN2_9BACT|nr:hypothetical protein [Prosthecobacter fusiformis]TDU81279.1 hypothetical protein EI77_00582 [Prosthecobacter fusiformis]